MHLCTVKTVIWQICSNRPGKKVPQSARLSAGGGSNRYLGNAQIEVTLTSKVLPLVQEHNRLSTRFVENTNRSRNHSCATQQWSGPMRAHVSCGSKVVLLVGLIFVLSCIALALATSSLQLTQSVVLDGASKDVQCPSFTLLLLLLTP